MSKYGPLQDHLRHSGEKSLSMTFATIESIVGALPATAHKNDAWWSNEDAKTTKHVQSKAWTEAGYQAVVDRKSKTVKFVKVR